MTKKRSKCLFVIFSIILVICLIASFISFKYPFSIGGKDYYYSSFIENLKLGEDVGNSVRIIYDIPEDETYKSNYEELRSSTMQDLKSIVQTEGYRDVSVAEYGQSQIVIQIGGIISKEDEEKVVSLIGNPTAISFSTNQDGSTPFADGDHIKSVTAEQYAPQGSAEISYVVVVEFKDEFKEMVRLSSQGKKVYIHLGENQFAELDYSNGGIQDGVIYLQSPTFENLLDAQTCASQIRVGMLDLSLTHHESARITPTYGVGAHYFILAAIIIAVIAGFVYMIVKYKHLGWIACFNFLFFISIALFLLQSIPLVHMNFGGIIGLALSFVLLADLVISLFERAKERYNAGAKLHIAFKMAEKEVLIRNLIKLALLVVVGVTCLFMPNLAVQSFGWVVFVCSLVSALVSLAMMKLAIKMYLPFNSTDGKKCNFHKGGKNA